MSLYLCEHCDREFPGSSRGSAFLVRYNAQTDHFCSDACLRAHTNRLPRPLFTVTQGLSILMGMTLMLHAVLGFIFTHGR